MKATVNAPVRELKAVLAEHLPWNGARISFLAQFLLALFKVRSVNLAERATGFGGAAKVDSHYKRLQHFFRSFEIDQDALARLLVRWVPVGDGSWRLTLDRTHWKFGQVDINFLVLGIAYRGIALPVFWSVLGKARQLRHHQANRPDGTLPRCFRRSPNRRRAGRPRIDWRGVVPRAANAPHSLPSTDQMQHPHPRSLEPDDAG